MPPRYAQNPLLRQLEPRPDPGPALAPPPLTFQSLMAALQTEETTPSTATADQSLNLWALMDALRTSGPGGNSALVSGKERSNM